MAVSDLPITAPFPSEIGKRTIKSFQFYHIFPVISIEELLEFPQFYPQWHSFSYIVINNFQEMLKI